MPLILEGRGNAFNPEFRAPPPASGGGKEASLDLIIKSEEQTQFISFVILSLVLFYV